eukprot:CAMPEP_0118884962 /NCGR_PEP_ID=MMETSP1163-20130328/23628_1 /TAXON_ID=124430 /ORGANISM="Phaeomonas parva, Strain CCMP2877" /LENGTH=55 /DNA_ID=CAMNT_0006822883 /DNA_START=262 /DNA_END=429 /DNA_ORIENTATION=-
MHDDKTTTPGATTPLLTPTSANANDDDAHPTPTPVTSLGLASTLHVLNISSYPHT